MKDDRGWEFYHKGLGQSFLLLQVSINKYHKSQEEHKSNNDIDISKKSSVGKQQQWEQRAQSCNKRTRLTNPGPTLSNRTSEQPIDRVST
ncbi:unnamed protein product [Ceratitis capitata]|uniref:(Mediterranean fruit fly) hypothetical protein n=1 Tax=Ceratitis capitata TaxID=7213 RepID=A0A811UUZ8_CERCA|nr:unnamed protein product [Ceratitis capitata]